jgi:hypothetical protein
MDHMKFVSEHDPPINVQRPALSASRLGSTRLRKASAWQALTCLAVAPVRGAKEERPTLNYEREKKPAGDGRFKGFGFLKLKA